jgi:hypothetical protein
MTLAQPGTQQQQQYYSDTLRIPLQGVVTTWHTAAAAAAATAAAAAAFVRHIKHTTTWRWHNLARSSIM